MSAYDHVTLPGAICPRRLPNRANSSLPAARSRKVLLQDLAGRFVCDLRHCVRRRHFMEIVHSPNERQVLIYCRDAETVFGSLHGMLQSVFGLVATPTCAQVTVA